MEREDILSLIDGIVLSWRGSISLLTSWNSPIWRGSTVYPSLNFLEKSFLEIKIYILEFPGIALFEGGGYPLLNFLEEVFLFRGAHPFLIPWNSLFLRISLLEFLGIILFGGGAYAFLNFLE